MFAQQKMMPTSGMDPAQAKMMLIMMPGMMLLFSYTFPSGLVLYWTVSNLLGIAQQLWIRKQMETADVSFQFNVKRCVLGGRRGRIGRI